jgi:hypothetical protein
MTTDKDLILLSTVVILIVAILIASLPLKNWLEIKIAQKKEWHWKRWLEEKPNKAEYCKINNLQADNIQCNFCGASRQLPSLKTVIQTNLKFGIFNNRFDKNRYFKAHICSGCGTELFRESYEK